MRGPLGISLGSSFNRFSGLNSQLRTIRNYSSESEIDPLKSRTRQVTVNRELPDPFKSKYENTKYFVTYGIGVLVSCIVIFNYEKTTSPILNSVFYVLRRDPNVTELLGEDIKYKSSWPWISGELNTVTGDIDINFAVKGDKSSGQLYFKATRHSKQSPFRVLHWYLEMPNGDKIDLKKSDYM